MSNLNDFNMRAYISKDLIEAYPDVLLDHVEYDRLMAMATDVVVGSVDEIDRTLFNVLGDYPGRLYFHRFVRDRLAVFSHQPE